MEHPVPDVSIEMANRFLARHQEQKDHSVESLKMKISAPKRD